ncbi:aminotransferase [Halobellus salinus]|uniref:Aminotransferase n=1 Tax=Halobellus salinus TaxID=931585 RepID=A0A830EC94_9EURY|nr:pyridoxal phosphate-dependent aminotransferase [Halobellus salinus]GGJ11280.1 aminotransferase [Halobellus salinus]SMP03740.1 aspartate aminotransferase/aminotransferase [Halobellus salinus]
MPYSFECTDRMARMPQSGIREIFDAAQDYDDLADLSIGEPDFATPEPIAAAVADAVGAGASGYTQTAGRSDLRAAIAEKLADANGIHADPETEVIVTPGAMGALFAATQVVADAGDEVLLPEPYWSNYHGHVANTGADLVTVPTAAADDFVPDPEAIARRITDDTAGVILNTPNNPTGAVVPPSTLRAIGEVLEAHDLWAILDETYEDLVYNGAVHHSLASDDAFFERSITVHTFSKSYAMTGWRIGYATGPADVIEQMRVLQEHTVSCAAEPAQVAAVAALDHPEVASAIHEAFARRRELILDRLADIPDVDPGAPQGAFYVFADVSALTDDTTEFTKHLLSDGVAAVPGSVFGAAGEGFVRFSYANDETVIRTAMDRFERAVETR